MKPIYFKQVNVTLAEHQSQYRTLPVYRGDDERGEVISCWELTWKERIILLFTGKLWLRIYTFGSLLQPQLPDVENPWST